MSKITSQLCIGVLFLLAFCSNISAQDIYWRSSTSTYAKNGVTDQSKHITFDINPQRVENIIKGVPYRFSKNNQKYIMSFPDENSKAINFVVQRTEVMHPQLSIKYPEVQTFVGVSIENPNEIIRFSYYPKKGLSGNIVRPGKSTLIIKPTNKISHVLYDSKNEDLISDFDCQIEDAGKKRLALNKGYTIRMLMMLV